MPNKIIVIWEDIGSPIGYAYNYQGAIALMKEKKWFDEEGMVKEFGEHWFERISRWDIESFNAEFEYAFYLEVADIYI